MQLSETARLLSIMARLRDRESGCPWDIEQNFSTIAPYTIEEAYEVAEAIASGDRDAMQDELGDLLLQVVFHSQMASEEGSFTFEDVARSINDKMIRRHPHVFAEAAITNADAQTENWENIKKQERDAKAKHGVLADVPTALPALMRAQKLQKRAARVGFDWPDISGVIAKVYEELAEVEEVLDNKTALSEELGDLLFAVVNIARFADIDAEEALRAANRKFIRRFEHVERTLGAAISHSSLDAMEAAWNEAKRQEKTA